MFRKETLHNCGCFVQRAFNSQQAIDIAASKPDLILADANMPGIEGGTLIAQLRRTPETKEIPIIAITESAAPDDTLKIWPTGGRFFTADTLVAEIMQIEHNSKRDK